MAIKLMYAFVSPLIHVHPIQKNSSNAFFCCLLRFMCCLTEAWVWAASGTPEENFSFMPRYDDTCQLGSGEEENQMYCFVVRIKEAYETSRAH